MTENERLKRSDARERAFLILFALNVNPDMDLEQLPEPDEELDITMDDFCRKLVDETVAHREEIDQLIESRLKGWTLSRIPRTSLTILRLTCAQLLYFDDIPAGAAINEAVELSKQYGDEDDYVFVNGTLGAIARGLE